MREANGSDIALERHSDSEFPNAHVRINIECIDCTCEHAVHGFEQRSRTINDRLCGGDSAKHLANGFEHSNGSINGVEY